MTEDETPKVNVSEVAVLEIKRQLQKRGTPDASFRMGINGGGCSGFQYHLSFEDNPPRDKDLVFNFDGLRVIVDKKSIVYLSGTTLEWEDTLLRKGFLFKNPNVKTNCGCGSSFTV